MIDITAVQTAKAAADDAFNDDKRRAEFMTAMAPFEKGQMYAFVPDAEKRKAGDAVVAEQNQRAAEALFALERAIRDTEPRLAADVALHRQPMPPDGFLRFVAAGTPNINHPIDASQVVACELLRQRVDREFREASPEEWYDRYVTALGNAEYDLESCIVVHATERAMAGRGWPGRAGNEGEAAAILKLTRLIKRQQDARVPKEVTAALEEVGAARLFVRLAPERYGIRARPPAHTATLQDSGAVSRMGLAPVKTVETVQ